jgi:hypothetical protein
MQFAGERLFHLAGEAEIESRESVSRPTENPAGCFVQARAALETN